MITAREFADRAIEMFMEASELLGCAETDDEKESQAEFEQAFRRLICEYKNHSIGPDACGKPEHDLCYRCNRLRVDIEASDAFEAIMEAVKASKCPEGLSWQTVDSAPRTGFVTENGLEFDK